MNTTLNVISRAEELNPFEESFCSSISTTPMLQLKSTDSSIFSSVSDNQILSDFSNGTSSGDSLVYSIHSAQQQIFDNNKAPSEQSITGTVKKRTRKVKAPKDEEKRRNFLERNRIAALKCRQRKKQWLLNLQARLEFLTNDNDQLQLEAEALRKEIMDLKTLLVAHKDCPTYKQNNSTSTTTTFYQHQHPLTAMGTIATRTKSTPVAYSSFVPTTATTATTAVATAAAAALYHATAHATANPRFF